MQLDDYQRQHLYGSARFASEADAQALAKGAAPIGVLGSTIIRRRREEPTLVMGGAGSGKGANLGLYQPVHDSTGSFLLLDMGGQYLSTTWHYNLAQRREAYAINVEGASSYPDINHPLNLWGILQPDDPLLLDHARRIAGMAITGERQGDNGWVSDGAKRWCARLLVGLVILDQRVTPASFWQHVLTLDSDDEYFKHWSRQLAPETAFSHAFKMEVYATALEIYSKKHHAEKEYGAIMGKLKDDFDWLSSPSVAASVSGEEDYLAYLPDPRRKVGIYYALKGGSGQFMESLTRMVVGIAMMHCTRHHQGKRPLFYLEEAATCGGAAFIKQLVSECRKYIDTVLVYQSQGQLTHLFGRAGAQEIQESCGTQIILGGGIRDINSARRYAEMIGRTTVYYDDKLAQEDRYFKAQEARQNALWQGDNLFDAERQYQHEMRQSQRRKRTGRYALDPAELMRLTDQILVFSPGAGIPPVLANKLPAYWQNPAMAGKYAPDPLFPPPDKVQIQHRVWGKQTKRFIRKAVPEKLAHWSNHINGEIAYVQGYKTW